MCAQMAAAAAAAAAPKPADVKANCWCFVWPTATEHLPSAPPDGWAMEDVIKLLAPGSEIKWGDDSVVGHVVKTELWVTHNAAVGRVNTARPVVYMKMADGWYELLLGHTKFGKSKNNCLELLWDREGKYVGARISENRNPPATIADMWKFHDLK